MPNEFTKLFKWSVFYKGDVWIIICYETSVCKVSDLNGLKASTISFRPVIKIRKVVWEGNSNNMKIYYRS